MCNCLILICRLVLSHLVPASIAARGAPGSLVRTVGAGSRGNKEKDADEEAVHWVYLTYIEKDEVLHMLRRGWWKLYLHPGDVLSDGVTEDMIVYYGRDVVTIDVVKDNDDDDGDLKPSALPPSALPIVPFPWDRAASAARASGTTLDQRARMLPSYHPSARSTSARPQPAPEVSATTSAAEPTAHGPRRPRPCARGARSGPYLGAGALSLHWGAL